MTSDEGLLGMPGLYHAKPSGTTWNLVFGWLVYVSLVRTLYQSNQTGSPHEQYFYAGNRPKTCDAGLAVAQVNHSSL